MAERLDDTQALESTTVGIYRTASVVKGGRRFSFAALVVVGDRRGSVGIGYGKAPGVPAAIEKAQKDARKQMFKVTLQKGTLPHPVQGRFGSSQIRLLPAAPGTGVIAGGTARAVLEMAGVNDCLTKAYGSTNKKNLCKAVIEGLRQLRLSSEIAALRGVEIGKTEVEEKIESAQKFMAATGGAQPTAPGGEPSKQAKQDKPKPVAAAKPEAEARPAESAAAATTEAAPEPEPKPDPKPEQSPEAPAADTTPPAPGGEGEGDAKP